MPAELKNSPLPALRLVKAGSPALDQIPTDRGLAGGHVGAGVWCRRAVAEVTFKLDYYSSAGLPRPLSAFDSVYKSAAAKLKIAGRHKYLTYGAWFRNELAPHVRQILADSQTAGAGIWN